MYIDPIIRHMLFRAVEFEYGEYVTKGIIPPTEDARRAMTDALFIELQKNDPTLSPLASDERAYDEMESLLEAVTIYHDVDNLVYEMMTDENYSKGDLIENIEHLIDAVKHGQTYSSLIENMMITEVPFTVSGKTVSVYIRID